MRGHLHNRDNPAIPTGAVISSYTEEGLERSWHRTLRQIFSPEISLAQITKPRPYDQEQDADV